MGLIFHAVQLTVKSNRFCVALVDTVRDMFIFFFHVVAIFDNHYWLCVS